MQAFTAHQGAVAPLDRVNVDTDQIIPKQYLKSIKRTGFGDYLFDGWRFLDEGDIGVTPMSVTSITILYSTSQLIRGRRSS